MSNGEEGGSVSIRIGEMLKSLSPSPSGSFIFKVHKHLRGINEKAYDPEIISIGPYHRDKENVQMMENYKLSYLELVLKRTNASNADKFVSALRPLEQEAHRFYAEPISLSSDDFMKMMLLDGCFIVELIRKFDMPHLRDRNDPIFKMDWMVNSLQRDLMLFENQLPFFVLCKLFDLIEVPDQHNRFIFLAWRFFKDLFPGPGLRQQVEENSDYKIRHLLGLIHNNWLPSFAGEDPNTFSSDKEGKKWYFIPNVSKLREVGVKLEKVEGGTLFDIKFSKGIFHIPPITIGDRTESFFRNLIAYEQYCPDHHLNYVTDYTIFLDHLVDSPKDVEILCHHGIMKNRLGNDEAVSLIFTKINDSVTVSDSHFQYATVFNEVNIHCSKRRNQWMAKLRRNYLNSPWAVISFLAAVLLLLLTTVQTGFTIFPRK